MPLRIRINQSVSFDEAEYGDVPVKQHGVVTALNEVGDAFVRVVTVKDGKQVILFKRVNASELTVVPNTRN